MRSMTSAGSAEAGVSEAGGPEAAGTKEGQRAHPERPLQRGFVRVTDRSGKTILHAGDARAAAALSLRIAHGSVEATVDGATARLERSSPKSYRPAKPAGGKAPQPGLFDE